MTNDIVKTSDVYPVGLVYDEAQNVLNRLNGSPIAYNDEDLKTLYALTDSELKYIRHSSKFAKEVVLATQDLKESGDDVRQKMRLQFAHYLDISIPQMMCDPEVPAKDKLSIMTMLGKGSGLLDESKSKEQQSANNAQSGPTFTLVLTTPTPVEPAYNIIQQDTKQ